MPKLISPHKMVFFLAVLIAFFVAGDYLLRYYMILPGFSKLERQEAATDVVRCKRAIEQDVRQVVKMSSDWAVWDDLYKYVVDRNEAFATSNFQWNTLPTTGIHLIYVINTSGQIVYSGAVDPMTLKKIKVRQLPAAVFPPGHYLLASSDSHAARSGILLTDTGPLLLTSHAILKSNGEGPSHGTLLFGRFLSKAIIKELAEQTRIDFTVSDPLTSQFSEEEMNLVRDLEKKEDITKIVNTNTLQAFGLMNDFGGRPALLITATLPRPIMQQGRLTARYSSIVLLSAVGLIIFSSIVISAILQSQSHRRQELVEALVEQRTNELRLSEERTQALSDATFEAIFLSENGICFEQNRTAGFMFGYTAAEAKGRRISAWFAHEDRAMVEKHVSENREKPYEVTALRKDGDTFPARVQARTITYHEQTVHVTALRDISEEKKAEAEQRALEDKLRRSQKMESLGLMASGVAHDLNNILSGIVSYPELILMNLPEESPLRQPIQQIRKSGKRAAEVVDDLLTLARGASSTREINCLNTIVEEYMESPEFFKLQSEHGNVRFSKDLDPELLNLSCSAIHVKKCVMNLVTNAAEAIEDLGEIVISTRNHFRETTSEGQMEMQPGEYTVLSIADTGPGIPQENLGRIFEPFYSRKVIGRSGTGLGLAIAWNTVQDHGGTIRVDSGSKGTTFELYFPATREGSTPLAESIDIEQYKGHGEKILVVDDDEGQRTIAVQILQLLNYTPYAVENGERAVLYLSEEKVDLVILDMIMDPGMNGCETYQRILELHPGQKAIVTSGFSESGDVKRTLHMGAGGFIKKPYLISRIALVIRDILHQS